VHAHAKQALGQLTKSAARKPLLDALDAAEPPCRRSRIISALGNFKDNAAMTARLEAVAREDKSYRGRAAALQAMAKLKVANAFATLSAAASSESPDDFLRNAALRAFGQLGDDKAVPLLVEWSAPGKPQETRQASISSLA